jgi:probable addiction module antidote protein
MLADKSPTRRGKSGTNMTLKTTRWDAAETLDTKNDVVAYLNVALEDGDPELLKLVLGDIARSKGMTEIARGAGLGRSSLYRALSPHGNPEFATVASVLKALGLRLSVARERAKPHRAPPRRAGATRSAIRKSA